MSVCVLTAPFDPQAEAARFCADRRDVGAVASFVGLCRGENDGKPVTELFLDYYPGFTERAMAKIEDEARQRFDLIDARIVHRAGAIAPGEPIVLALAAGVHRAAALQAVGFMMDHLKTDAPFWKREDGPGGARWIEARPSDRAARAAWENKP